MPGMTRLGSRRDKKKHGGGTSSSDMEAALNTIPSSSSPAASRNKKSPISSSSCAATLRCGLILAAALGAVVAQADPIGRSCGAPNLTVGIISAAAAQVTAFATGGGSFVTGGVINTYWHIINKGDGISNGNLTDLHIETQNAVLTARYRLSGWTFQVAGIDRTNNASWFTGMTPASKVESAAKKALHKGTAQDLNIYTVGSRQYLGYSTFPWDYVGAPHLDGVVLLYTTLPGVEPGPFSLGETASHEVGHWMGLFHTFEPNKNFCSPVGDYVADTPVEKSPGYGCPVGRDSCPLSPGKDDYQNIMGYADDACMRHFTRGQTLRMQQMYSVYRMNK